MNDIKVWCVLSFFSLYMMLSGISVNATERVVTFGVDSDFPPFSFVVNNSIHGYELDLIKLIFEKSEYKLEFNYGEPWGEIYIQTTNNQMDICGTLVRTPERAAQVNFTDDAYTRYYGVFINANSGKIDINDMRRYRLGAVKGYFSEVIVRDQIKSSNYEVFDTYLKMIMALKENRIDAFIETTQVVKYYISKNNLIGQFVLQHDGLFLQGVPFGVSKKRPDLVTFINKRLKEIKSSGEYEILYIKNFSTHSSDYYNARRNNFIWLIVGLVISALAFIVLLKVQVRRATSKIVEREAEIRLKNEELENVNEELNVTLEEIEAINEELNATLEEMEASNEELISTNSELEKTQILLKSSLESPKDMIIMAVDRNYQYLYFNKAHSDAMKNSYNKEVAIGINVLDYITSEEDRRNAKFNYDRAMSGEFHTTVQEYGDVERVYYESMYNPIYDDGEIIGITAFARNITEWKQAEEKIKSLLEGKELLLHEVHHRIKNNMNTIKGLLTLQLSAEENPSVAASLHDAESRVQSMIMLYDRLYSTENFRELSVKEYIQPLTEDIVGSFPNFAKVKIETDIEDFILNVNTLSPLGIIINELLTNMMKYAFNGRDSGVIKVSASMKNNIAVVHVQDNGVGMPEAIDFKNSTGFGLELVNMLVKQMGGSIRIERGEGTKFVLEFTV